MDIDGGDLVSGQIQVVARTGSIEKQYDLAGNVVTEVSNGGTGVGIQTQSFTCDARGEMTYTLMPPLDSSHGGVRSIASGDKGSGIFWDKGSGIFSRDFL